MVLQKSVAIKEKQKQFKNQKYKKFKGLKSYTRIMVPHKMLSVLSKLPRAGGRPRKQRIVVEEVLHTYKYTKTHLL